MEVFRARGKYPESEKVSGDVALFPGVRSAVRPAGLELVSSNVIRSAEALSKHPVSDIVVG